MVNPALLRTLIVKQRGITAVILKFAVAISTTNFQL